MRDILSDRVKLAVDERACRRRLGEGPPSHAEPGLEDFRGVLSAGELMARRCGLTGAEL